MFRLFKKHKTSQGSRIKHYEEGKLPCDTCGHTEPLDGLTPLQLHACPKCGNHNFVPLLIEHYWLNKPLGGGGMGSVYQAYDKENPNITVAVKLIPPDRKNDTDAVEALYQEAEIAQKAGDHPCLAGVLQRGCSQGRHFAIMEFIHGERLDNVVEHQNSLPVEQVLQIALDIIDADWHLYNTGYLYRDLKPQNIILSDEKKRAILFDYGLCISIEEAHNPEGDVCAGSPHFVPPERLRGLSEDVYSEIYSLGMVMYYALTGSTFFRADEVQALAQKHIAQLRIPMRTKLKGYPTDLVELMSKMTNKDASKRHQTFKEAQDEVKAVKEGLK